jgi:hypothetical protein
MRVGGSGIQGKLLFRRDRQPCTYRFGGRDFRLTDVHGKVMEKNLG